MESVPVDQWLDLTDPADLARWDASAKPGEAPLPLSAYRARKVAATGFDINEPRIPGGEHGGEWTKAGEAIKRAFSSMHDPQAIRSAYAYHDERTGWYSTIDAIRPSPHARRGTVYVSGTIRDQHGDIIGQTEHAILPESQNHVRVDGLILDPEHRGEGFGSRFQAHAEDVYRSAGVQYLSGTANIDVGGYSWASAGWEFGSRSGRANVRDRVRREMTRFNPDVQAKFRAIIDRPDFEPIEVARVGWEPGMGGSAVWPGKTVMLGSSWDMRKEL